MKVTVARRWDTADRRTEYGLDGTSTGKDNKVNIRDQKLVRSSGQKKLKTNDIGGKEGRVRGKTREGQKYSRQGRKVGDTRTEQKIRRLQICKTQEWKETKKKSV